MTEAQAALDPFTIPTPRDLVTEFAGQISESANPIAHKIAATANDITIQNFQ